MKALKPFLTFALFFMCAALLAQTDFSGTWSLNQSKSKFGEGGGPGGPGGPMMGPSTLVIKQAGNVLTVDRTMQGPGGDEFKLSEKYTLDGKESENTFMMDSKRKSTVTWSADKKSLSFASTMEMNMGGNSMEMKESETWKLGEGGKALVIDSQRPTPDGGIMNMTMVYDKK